MIKFIPVTFAIVVITIIFGTIEVTDQQALRMNANDPQIQLAQDTANALNEGAQAQNLVHGKIRMNKSLAPFVIIYNKSGQAVSGDGLLNDKIPSVPIGVLAASKNKEYNAVTWQPQSGVRIASVSVAARDYYVLSGRSLNEVEKREQQALQLASFGWATAVGMCVVGAVVVSRFTKLLTKS